MTISATDRAAIAKIRSEIGADQKVIFVSGAFNVVHPGHVRLLNFGAECGDVLVVGVYRDGIPSTVVPQHLRLESAQAISVVDHAFIMESQVEQVITSLKPDVVVKGKEHEDGNNREQAAVDSYGGELLFGSGDVRFSSMELLRSEFGQLNLSAIKKPDGYCDRHRFTMNDLEEIVDRFLGLNVVVVGDLIIDEYISCEPLGMSQEDPTLVISPLASELFTGGAGIVSAHAQGLGANARLISVLGEDETAKFAVDRLSFYGVEHHLLSDSTRPTTLKKRYRAHGKTLLRVNELRQHDINKELGARFLDRTLPLIEKSDVLIFSDFNYGCLPQGLVDSLRQRCEECGVMMAADSQASSQFSDISRFKNMKLVTPTEREARLAVRDFSSGLVKLASSLQEISGAENVLMTLGSEGVLVQTLLGRGSNELMTDRLFAMNTSPRDVAGGGDSMLVTAAMALTVGASIWEAAYLGSLAAACQVGRVGNVPIKAEELISEIRI